MCIGNQRLVSDPFTSFQSMGGMNDSRQIVATRRSGFRALSSEVVLRHFTMLDTIHQNVIRLRSEKDQILNFGLSSL